MDEDEVINRAAAVMELHPTEISEVEFEQGFTATVYIGEGRMCTFSGAIARWIERGVEH